MQDADRVVLEIARMVREHLLGQSAFDEHDAYSTVDKTALMARLAVAALEAAEGAVAAGAAATELDLSGLRRAFAELRRSATADLPAVSAQVTAAIDWVTRAGVHAQEALPRSPAAPTAAPAAWPAPCSTSRTPPASPSARRSTSASRDDRRGAAR